MTRRDIQRTVVVVARAVVVVVMHAADGKRTVVTNRAVMFAISELVTADPDEPLDAATDATARQRRNWELRRPSVMPMVRAAMDLCRVMPRL